VEGSGGSFAFAGSAQCCTCEASAPAPAPAPAPAACKDVTVTVQTMTNAHCVTWSIVDASTPATCTDTGAYYTSRCDAGLVFGSVRLSGSSDRIGTYKDNTESHETVCLEPGAYRLRYFAGLEWGTCDGWSGGTIEVRGYVGPMAPPNPVQGYSDPVWSTLLVTTAEHLPGDDCNGNDHSGCSEFTVTPTPAPALPSCIRGVAGSPSSVLICVDCAAGRFSDVVGATECAGACAAGSQSTPGSTDASDCADCPAGKLDTRDQDPAPAGVTWEMLPDTKCLTLGPCQLTSCSADDIDAVKAACTADASCIGFTVMPAGVKMCTNIDAQFRSGATAYIPSSLDPACTNCAAGRYSDAVGVTECAGTCAVGSHSPPGSITASDCAECPAGKSDADQDPATACADCEAGRYSDAVGSAAAECTGGCAEEYSFSIPGSTAPSACHTGPVCGASEGSCPLGQFCLSEEAPALVVSWKIISGGEYCHVTTDGLCVTNQNDGKLTHTLGHLS
jgi:hypothetical protein